MTPLYAILNRFLPPAWSVLAMVAVYTTLIVLIVMFQIAPNHFDLIYLDLGR